MQWGDRVNGDRATEFEEISGYHLEQAHRYLIELGLADEHAIAVGAEAGKRLASAGRRAFVRGDMNAAANLLLRATSPLPPNDPMRLAIFPDLGEALMQLGEFEQAASLLEDAVATAELAGEATLAANAWLVRQFVLLLSGETDGVDRRGDAGRGTRRSRSAKRRATTPGSHELRGCWVGSTATHVATEPPSPPSSGRSSMRRARATCARSAAHRRSTRS